MKSIKKDTPGQRIAALCKDYGISQKELAEKIGVSDKTISNWENARCLPDLSLFSPLCKILDISINDLLSGEQVDSKDYNEKLEENIVNTIDYLDKKILNQKLNFRLNALFKIARVMNIHVYKLCY